MNSQSYALLASDNPQIGKRVQHHLFSVGASCVRQKERRRHPLSLTSMNENIYPQIAQIYDQMVGQIIFSFLCVLRVSAVYL